MFKTLLKQIDDNLPFSSFDMSALDQIKKRLLELEALSSGMSYVGIKSRWQGIEQLFNLLFEKKQYEKLIVKLNNVVHILFTIEHSTDYETKEKYYKKLYAYLHKEKDLGFKDELLSHLMYQLARTSIENKLCIIIIFNSITNSKSILFIRLIKDSSIDWLLIQDIKARVLESFWINAKCELLILAKLIEVVAQFFQVDLTAEANIVKQNLKWYEDSSKSLPKAEDHEHLSDGPDDSSSDKSADDSINSGGNNNFFQPKKHSKNEIENLKLLDLGIGLEEKETFLNFEKSILDYLDKIEAAYLNCTNNKIKTEIAKFVVDRLNYEIFNTTATSKDSIGDKNPSLEKPLDIWMKRYQELTICDDHYMSNIFGQ